MRPSACAKHALSRPWSQTQAIESKNTDTEQSTKTTPCKTHHLFPSSGLDRKLFCKEYCMHLLLQRSRKCTNSGTTLRAIQKYWIGSLDVYAARQIVSAVIGRKSYRDAIICVVRQREEKEQCIPGEFCCRVLIPAINLPGLSMHSSSYAQDNLRPGSFLITLIEHSFQKDESRPDKPVGQDRVEA